jgi:hypothetical protein
MGDIDRLLSEYIQQQLAGQRPDPMRFIEQLDGDERELLSNLIDAYLLDAPREPFDAVAYKGSAAERAVEAIDRSLHGQSGLWPSLLPRLRDRAQLKRTAVVAKLAVALGAPAKEAKVGDYYHQMEQGLLPAVGVSSRVLDALASIVGTSADALRRAGEAIRPGGADTLEVRAMQDPAFARTGLPDLAKGPVPAPAEAQRSPAENEWDDIDEMFRGG